MICKNSKISGRNGSPNNSQKVLSCPERIMSFGFLGWSRRKKCMHYINRIIFLTVRLLMNLNILINGGNIALLTPIKNFATNSLVTYFNQTNVHLFVTSKNIV
jgi:hypothetical protein